MAPPAPGAGPFAGEFAKAGAQVCVWMELCAVLCEINRPPPPRLAGIHQYQQLTCVYAPPKQTTQQEDVIAFLGPSQSAICVAPKPLPGQPPTAYVDLAGFAKVATAGGAVGAQALALFENAARQMDNALGQVCVGVWVGEWGGVGFVCALGE